MVREIISEGLEIKYCNTLELLPFFDILDIANAISWKVLVLEAADRVQ